MGLTAETLETRPPAKKSSPSPIGPLVEFMDDADFPQWMCEGICHDSDKDEVPDAIELLGGTIKLNKTCPSASVTGDPHVTNLAGEHFDIYPSGNFGFLSIRNESSSSPDLLVIEATVQKAKADCEAWTWMQEVVITGDWIQQGLKIPSVAIRAVQDVPIVDSLEVKTSVSWEKSTTKTLAKPAHEAKSWTSSKRIVINTHGIKIKVSIHGHDAVKTRRYLNLDVEGLLLYASSWSRLKFGGLLGYDDHEFVSKLPDNCDPVTNPRAKVLRSVRDEASFQSFVHVA